MHGNNNIGNDILGLIIKSWLWLGILFAVIAKISVDILGKRKMTGAQWVAIVGVSAFAGYMTGVWCYSRGWYSEALWMAPFATLFGERLIAWVTQNFNGIMRFIFLKKGGGDEPKGD